MSTVPQVLDWVSARAACNVGQVFDELCAGIQKDVEGINAARHLREYERFHAQMSPDNNAIVVGQESARTPRIVVKIGLDGNAIRVGDGTKTIEWSVRVALNDAGRCTLRCKGESGAEIELEQWQFRKRALEGLFFGD